MGRNPRLKAIGPLRLAQQFLRNLKGCLRLTAIEVMQGEFSKTDGNGEGLTGASN
jgi:hypothetical protein